MNDVNIIRKTNENGKVDATEQLWLAHVREYHIFDDAQARLIVDALRDVQVYARNDCKKEIDDLQKLLGEAMVDFVMDKTGSLPNEVRVLRERLAMLEGQIKAMTDLKGVPGKLGECGARGEPGRQGEKGDVGPRGAAAPHWIGVKIEGFDLITVLSDGTFGPRISLKQMFEDFLKEQLMVGT
jgi:hypothetical protein